MLRFMKNKILIPLLIIGALAAFFSFKYSGGDSTTSDAKKALVLETVMKTIQQGHYSPRPLDDSFSARVYNKVLGDLDYDKKFFTQKDINELDKYKYQIDDEIKNGSVEFYNKLSDLFTKRIDDADKYYKEILKTPFTFTGNEKLQLDGEKQNYAANDNELKERWKEFLKYRVLAKYVDLQNDQKKRLTDSTNKAKDTIKVKTNTQLEADAREAVKKNQDSYFKRLHKLTDDDRFTLFVNCITNSEDPHTDYFPPKEKQRFDEAMSGTFYGIGAQLRQDGDKIKVEAIITGSPCWKQGELKAGDEIMKVAQAEKEPVDVEGYDIEDVVQLIRGKKGTEVRLTVKQPSGSIKVVPIIRGEVLIDATFAHSAIIKSEAGPIGYIYLPEFYSDFQHINGRRCADDVAVEVQKLKSEGVAGIILDLRNNGGGSLSDVVDMAGLFVGHGPVVQVKSNDASPIVLRSPDKPALYTGPMAVMVNQNSASASEIMAAALQDYKRAIVVGSTTYGKGTVQKIVPLDEFIDPLTRMKLQSEAIAGKSGSVLSSLGSLKITVQKFYRINGGSTQLKGVTPDVVMPDPYSMVDNGERHDKAALPWDEIPAADYTPTNSLGDLHALVTLSETRIANNPTFQLIKQNAEKLKKQEEDNSVSLNETSYRQELDEANATSKKLEELQKKVTAFDFTNPKADMSHINADSASIAKNNEWLKNLKKDIYISETVNILNDMNKSKMNVNMGTGMNMK